jgi:tetratricopeptide (TPR) repeat protein
VVRAADPDPVRDRLRQPELWDDGPGLTKLAGELPFDKVSPQLASALARVLLKTGGNPIPLLSAVQALNPQDFWLNFELGWALLVPQRREEALGFYRAALALRPDSSAAHNGVGLTLNDLGRSDEAIVHFKQALDVDPNFAMAHYNLGLALRDKGRLDEAITHFQESIRLNPKGSAMAHFSLGIALREKGRLDEAIDHLQQAVRLDGSSTSAEWLYYCLYVSARENVQAITNDSGRLDETVRAEKRRQALARLRAVLDLKVKPLKEGRALDRSIAALQADPVWTSVREPAALAKLPDVERAQWQRFWSDLAVVVASDPFEQRLASVAHRNWTQAAEGYAQAYKRAPTNDGQFWYEYAAVSELSGDRNGYKNACDHMIDAFGKNGGPRAYHVARACTLAPDAVADISVPTRLAERELQGHAGEFWSLTEQGALAYRAGHFKESVPLFEQSLQANSKPGAAVVNWLWLALANQRLGKNDEARSWLTKAKTWLDQFHDGLSPHAEQDLGLHVHNWLEANVLRREAEAMISPAASTAPTQ